MLKPGKGSSLVLNEATRQFLVQCLEDVQQAYTDELHDSNPVAVLQYLLANPDQALYYDWSEENDDYGHKAFTKTPYKTGALRVTVVLTKQGDLRLDIREWFDPNAAR